jgi:hypothetical protein
MQRESLLLKFHTACCGLIENQTGFKKNEERPAIMQHLAVCGNIVLEFAGGLDIKEQRWLLDQLLTECVRQMKVYDKQTDGAL